MANPELGAKQICPTCQSKFYDLNRRPATCPKCGSSFDPEEAVKVRRVRTRGATPDYEDAPETPAKPAAEEAEGYEDEVEDTPEIDQAADAEVLETDDDEDVDPAAGPAAPDSDLGVDFEEEGAEAEGEDVPFLEEEDDDFPEDDIEGLPGEDEGEEH